MLSRAPTTAWVGLTVWLVLASAAHPFAFDKVLLKDGRMIEGTIAESDDDQYVVIELPGTTIPIHQDLIDQTYVENLENYVPKNKKEESYLKKGWVLFEGGWMSKARREQELKRRADTQNEAIEKARHEQDWANAKIEETRHFIVTSNLPQSQMDEYVERLEIYYKSFTTHWNIKLSPGESKGKMKVFLYRTPADFYKVTRVPYGVAGFFSRADGELHLYHNPEEPEQSLDTLFHEGNHLLTFLIDTRFGYPVWLNEGMAEYYGTAEIDEKKNFNVGGLQYGRIVSLNTDRDAGNFMKLRDVMLTEHANFRARHYAVAWSFVHFLMESPEYGKRFRGFFANLPENRDLPMRNVSYSNVKGTIAEVELPDVITALEKRLGKSLEDLEGEWLAHIDQAYGELTPQAYYLAARLALRLREKDGSHVDRAFGFYEKAVAMGIENANCYRSYAELLRKGGISENRDVFIQREPDGPLAWDMIQKAIDLDPLNPLNYCEAAGALILDSDAQDLDRAEDMVKTAKALAPTNYAVRSLTNELMSLIEPARERRRLAAEAKAMDQRIWHIQPFFYDGEDAPDKIEDLATADVEDLVRDGTFKKNDWVFQVWRPEDPVTGELMEGTEPWDLAWVALETVPAFAEALAEVESTDG